MSKQYGYIPYLWTLFLQSKISFWIQASVWLTALITYFSYYVPASYEFVPLETIDTILFKATTPHSKIDTNKKTCSYNFIYSNESFYNKLTSEIVKEADIFIPQGIVNGSFTPENCNPLFSVAILVPYRNRQKQLNVFIPYMHNFLRKQNIHYKIYVIEQLDNKWWNKGILYNIGASVAAIDQFPCIVLHDVDLLPLDISNIYACAAAPRHQSARIRKMRNILPYKELVGGVMAIGTDVYRKVGGMSHNFQGWGGEDDDLQQRLAEHGYEVVRFPPWMSRYVMLPHPPSPAGPSPPPADVTGLHDIWKTSYRVTQQRLFTLISVRT